MVLWLVSHGAGRIGCPSSTHFRHSSKLNYFLCHLKWAKVSRVQCNHSGGPRACKLAGAWQLVPPHQGISLGGRDCLMELRPAGSVPAEAQGNREVQRDLMYLKAGFSGFWWGEGLSRAVILNLWVLISLGIEYQISCISDIYDS